MSKSAWAGLILVFLVGATARVGWVVVRHGSQPAALAYPDEHAYLLAAESLAAGEGLVDEFGFRATYMPAYPAFIALFQVLGLPLMSMRLVQALVGALAGPATFLLAREWLERMQTAAADKTRTQHDKSMVVACLAGLAAACDPFLIFFSGLLLTEALFAVALVVTWWLVLGLLNPVREVSPARSLASGSGVLACVMLRPSSTLLIPLVPGLVLVYRLLLGRAATALPGPATDSAVPSGSGARVSHAVLSAVIVMVVVVAGLFPWAVRNARVLGEWRWTTTRGGISLYDGLQPGAAGGSDLAHTKQNPRATGLGELAWDAHWRATAMHLAREDPARVVVLGGRKFLRMWNLVPNEPAHRQGTAPRVSAAWMVLVLGTAMLGWWSVRRNVSWWIALLAPVMAFTLLHMLFVGSVRYRIPLMPMVFVLSAVGLQVLTGRVWRRTESPRREGASR